MLRHDIELIEQTIATMKLERESKAEHHISQQFCTLLKDDETSQIGILNKLRNQLTLPIFLKRQSLKNVEVAHERKQWLNIAHFSKPK